MIKTIIDDQKRTPLLIDNSEDDKVTAFLSYKAVLVDVSVLAVGYQKSGTKVRSIPSRNVQLLYIDAFSVFHTPRGGWHSQD